MAAKAILALCASALFLQISAQTIRNAGVVDITDVNVIGNGATGWVGNGIVNGVNAGYGLAGSSWTGNTLAGLTGNVRSGWAGGLSNIAGYGLAGNGLATGIAGFGNGIASFNGGALPISSATPMAPIGLSIFSENIIEGPLTVTGQMPLLATVAVDGQVPSAGSASVSYGCGNGNIGIVSEGLNGLGEGIAYGAGVINTGIAAAPLATGFATAPLATGFAAGPLATGFASAPFTTGFAAAPLVTEYAAAPLATGFATAPLATGFAAGSLATGIASAPVFNAPIAGGIIGSSGCGCGGNIY